MPIPPSYLFKSIYFDHWEHDSSSDEESASGKGPGTLRLTLLWLAAGARRLSSHVLAKPASAASNQGPAFGC